MPVLAQWLNHNQVDLGSGVEATTDDPPDGQGSLAPPASRRPPSSGSSSGPSELPDQQKTARAHARNWLQGAMSTMATSPQVPRPAADPNGPSETRRVAITALEHAAILREHDSKVEETKQNSTAKIKQSIVFLTHEQGYHD